MKTTTWNVEEHTPSGTLVRTWREANPEHARAVKAWRRSILDEADEGKLWSVTIRPPTE